eukprot:scaffold231102_cov35-Tisochrysis_lutea.AAC.1
MAERENVIRRSRHAIEMLQAELEAERLRHISSVQRLEAEAAGRAAETDSALQTALAEIERLESELATRESVSREREDCTTPERSEMPPVRTMDEGTQIPTPQELRASVSDAPLSTLSSSPAQTAASSPVQTAVSSPSQSSPSNSAAVSPAFQNAQAKLCALVAKDFLDLVSFL